MGGNAADGNVPGRKPLIVHCPACLLYLPSVLSVRIILESNYISLCVQTASHEETGITTAAEGRQQKHAARSSKEAAACFLLAQPRRLTPRTLSGQAWPTQIARRVLVQYNAAVESQISHIWLCDNMLFRYDQHRNRAKMCLRFAFSRR